MIEGRLQLRTPLPRYNETWDPAVVLNYLSGWYPNDDLSLEKVSEKLVTLLALITAHRVQTLALIKINNIKKYSNEKIVIHIPDKIISSGVIEYNQHLYSHFTMKDHQSVPLKH